MGCRGLGESAERRIEVEGSVGGTRAWEDCTMRILVKDEGK